MPVALAYAPFGLALGATLAASRIPRLIAWSSSPLLFSGAAQLLAVQLLDAGASRPAYAAAAAGGLVAVVASGLPLGLGLLAGGPGSRADPGRVRAGRAGRVHHFVYDVITDGVPVAIEVDIPDAQHKYHDSPQARIPVPAGPWPAARRFGHRGLRCIMWGFDSVLAS